MCKKNIKSYFRLLAFALFGCSLSNGVIGDSSVAISNQRPKLIASEWETTRQGRVIRVLSFGDFMSKALWNDPSVIKKNDRYIMYATANIGGTWGTVLPFRGTSVDGVRWTMDTNPLLTLGKKGAFDSGSIETPSVVKFKGKYHMFYTGVVRGFFKQKLAIGHAISEDGIAWRKVSDTPFLAPTGNPNKDWNGYHVAEPGAVVFNNMLYVYFHASGRRPDNNKPSNQSSIGVVVSEDGFQFSEMRRVLTQGPLYPTSVPEKYSGYSTPSAVVAGNTLHLFYDVIATNPGWEQVALHHATSSDGLNFQEDDQSLLRREELSWTKNEVRSPAVLYENNQFKLWFAGHDKKNLQSAGIGFMELR